MGVLCDGCGRVGGGIGGVSEECERVGCVYGSVLGVRACIGGAAVTVTKQTDRRGCLAMQIPAIRCPAP